MRRAIAISSLCLLFSPAVLADSYSNVSINGQVLTGHQLARLEQQIGTPVVPGNYLVNWANGCWANLSTGASGCLNGSGDLSPGAGRGDDQGNWYYHSGPAGGAVGGTADGCVYTTFGWSNC